MRVEKLQNAKASFYKYRSSKDLRNGTSQEVTSLCNSWWKEKCVSRGSPLVGAGGCCHLPWTLETPRTGCPLVSANTVWQMFVHLCTHGHIRANNSTGSYGRMSVRWEIRFLRGSITVEVWTGFTQLVVLQTSAGADWSLCVYVWVWLMEWFDNIIGIKQKYFFVKANFIKKK